MIRTPFVATPPSIDIRAQTPDVATPERAEPTQLDSPVDASTGPAPDAVPKTRPLDDAFRTPDAQSGPSPEHAGAIAYRTSRRTPRVDRTSSPCRC